MDSLKPGDIVYVKYFGENAIILSITNGPTYEIGETVQYKILRRGKLIDSLTVWKFNKLSVYFDKPR